MSGEAGKPAPAPAPAGEQRPRPAHLTREQLLRGYEAEAERGHEVCGLRARQLRAEMGQEE